MIVQTTYAPRLCDLLEYGFDIGLRDYPIYDESDRDRLNQAIVDHFYTREIAAESPALFIMRLNITMRERMPQINKVHALLADADLASSFEQTTEGSTGTQSGSTSTSSAQSTAQAKNYNSNAPQVSMVGKDEVSYYDTGATSTNDADSTSRDESSSGSTSSTTSKSSGRNASIPSIVSEYYEGYNNTDLMVFDALEVCFSHVYQCDIAPW